MPSQPPDTEHVVNIHRITPSNQKIPIDGLDANENTCTKTSLSQETPKSLGILPKKGISSYYQYQSTCSNCKRDCEMQISPEKALESDELRDDVEMSRRRRLLVVSIDSSSSLLFKTHGATVPRKPPRNGVVSYYSLR